MSAFLKVWSEDDCSYMDYEDEDEFFLIPESSKLPIPTAPRRPHQPSSEVTAVTSNDIGERVVIFGEKRGILRYIGPTHFESGEWCGIELDLPEGKNNGAIESTEYFRCLPNHGIFVPSYHVELFKTIQPKKFSLCLREIESGSSTSSSLAETEDQRSFLQFKANRRKDNMKAGVRPVSGRYPSTKIPMPENLSAKRSHQNQRKRHLAGGSPASSSAIPELSNSKNNRQLHSNSNIIQDLKDTRIQSRSVLQQQPNTAPESDMESSLGILSPSDMKSEFVIMSTTSNNVALSGDRGCMDSVINFRNNNNNITGNNQGGGWTGSDMIRSRTFTRELNDPKAESELIVEDLDQEEEKIPNTKPRKNNNNIRQTSVNVKKFKLNTFQIEADDDTRILMSRTESLLQSSKSRNGSNNSTIMKSSESSTGKKSFKKLSNNTNTRHEESSNIVSDISAETFQSRTEALLHSKTKRKKKKHHSSNRDFIPPADQGVTTDSSGSSWSNIPRCFQNVEKFTELRNNDSGSGSGIIPGIFRNPGSDQLISASILSSDAGISSMPSSMISNISVEKESQQQFQFHGKMKFHHHPMKIHNLEYTNSGPYSLPTPDVLHAEPSPEMKNPEFQKIRQRSQEKGMASKRADLLSENPIRPNTNVGSKLKEMLAEKSHSVNPKKLVKPKGKWDAIMSQISENKIKSKNSEQPNKLKEIKSKVFADFKPPPKLIRHQSINGSSKKISNSDKRSLPSRSNSTLSSNGGGCVIDNITNYRGSSNLPSRSNSSNGCSGVAGGCVENVVNSRGSNLPSRSNSSNGGAGLLEPRTFTSRSTSSTSVTSQIILEEDRMSDCTLKDVLKKPSDAKDFIKNNAAAVSRKNSTASRKSQASSKTTQNSVKSTSTTKESTSSSNYLRNHHQPDLVKVSQSPKVVTSNAELARLEHILDEKNRENERLRARLGHNAKGFEALAVTVNHLSKKLDEFDKLDYTTRLNDLKHQVQSKEEQLEQLRLQISQKQNEPDIDEVEASGIIKTLENRLNILQDEHEELVEKLRHDHNSEMDLQAQSHQIEFRSLETKHLTVLQDHEARHSDILQEMEEKWKQTIARQLEDKTQELNQLTDDLERQSEKYQEMKQNLEHQLHSVQNELRQQEMAVTAKHKGDLIVKSTQNKLTKVMAEVDSLKAVLEMKTEEIHALRLEKAKLEDKLEEFDRMKLDFGKVTAQLEDLKAQLNEKQVVERKLSEENRQLYNSVERELNAKRRITMEKEELEWKIRSSSRDGTMSMSMMEGYSGFESMTSMTSLTSTPTSLHSKGSLTASYSEHCPQSLPPFTGRSRKCRPMSAPPGKFDLASLAKSLKDQAGPDSPRLSGVVEKEESVAWKIEYNEDEEEQPDMHLTAAGSSKQIQLNNSSNRSSPALKRKSTPPAQMMTKSLERLSVNKPASRSNSVRKKIIPSFEPLSESTESDSLEEQFKVSNPFHEKSSNPSDQDNKPASVNIEDLDDDIGDISSSSEIEIDEPLAEVTTPQIEALMFPAGAGCSTSGSTGSSDANMSSPDAEITIKADLVKSMNASLPTYDLNTLFSGVQDSGGEAMMTFTAEDNLLMVSSSASTNPNSDMVDSTVSMTSWSEQDLSTSSS